MPAGKTYVKIASQTLGSASASVTFSNLPQNYTDLVIMIAGSASSGTDAVEFKFNSDSGSNYSRTVIYGDGTNAGSLRTSNATSTGVGLLGSVSQGNVILHFMNYSNSTTYKTIISRANIPGDQTRASVGLWRSVSAINTINISIATSFTSGTTFTIYGIEAAKSPYAEGGDKVYSTGTHWVHEFYYSGTFVPRQNLTADYLVVAGGGGGGTNVNGFGGGGGAGGLRSTVTATGGGGSLESALSLAANTGYTVTVGAGGAASTNGNNSTFSTITSTAGGRGGNATGGSGTGQNGGSGGGGGEDSTKGLGTVNQGYDGGNGTGGANQGGGGGGGAGAAGATASGGGGNGGNGVATSITGSSVTYAGGGGGGYANGNASSGGTGGGGVGVKYQTSNATNGSTNTGSGGGGGVTDRNGGAGGSGIVIVRYAI